MVVIIIVIQYMLFQYIFIYIVEFIVMKINKRFSFSVVKQP